MNPPDTPTGMSSDSEEVYLSDRDVASDDFAVDVDEEDYDLEELEQAHREAVERAEQAAAAAATVPVPAAATMDPPPASTTAPEAQQQQPPATASSTPPAAAAPPSDAAASVANGVAAASAPAPAEGVVKPAAKPAVPGGGLGMGLGGALPARRKDAPAAATAPAATAAPAAPAAAPEATPAPAASSSQPTPAAGATTSAAAAAPKGLPSLPAKPAGGLGSLPPRQGAAKPAGGLGSLPPRSAGAGTPSPPPTTATPAPTPVPPAAVARPAQPPQQQQPQAVAAARPVLPPRPGLPLRPAAPAAGGSGAVTVSSMGLGSAASAAGLMGIVDDDEPKPVRKARKSLQDVRVALVRAATRLGLSAQSEAVGSLMAALERLEKANLPYSKKRIDVNRAAQQTAVELNERDGPDARVGLQAKVMLLGMTGVGKSELINALLERPASSTNAFKQATNRVKVVKGSNCGIDWTFIDTPGLQASADMALHNKGLLKAIKGAYKRHKPHFVIYVDRLDAVRPSFGDMSTMSSITEALGKAVWRETMVVLTHANAAREVWGREYFGLSKRRRDLLESMVRQAAGEAQLRTPFFMTDAHPEGPRSPSGQPVVFAQMPMGATQSVPWRQNLLFQLAWLAAQDAAQKIIRGALPKPKKAGGAAKAAAGGQAAMFQQMMRSRLPPTNYFVEQMVEGVQKPDGWPAHEDPFDQETEDEEAEEFHHMYYTIMRRWAKRGDPGAQKEYAMMLRKQQKANRAYAEALENEEIESMANYGYEGYVVEGLDLGPTFDPEDNTDHRYAYPLSDSAISIMPTLDYYGWEHEDAITGFIAEWSTQLGHRDGWGGVPFDVTACIEKDKTTTCLQVESNASIIHCVPPFGSRHISQLGLSAELLRPNVKDVLYTLEMNTYKDGLVKRNDHAGFGMLVARMAEGGNPRKGPSSIGVRVQESMRIGPLKVDAVAAQVRGETPQGGRDEGWGARAFVLNDIIPGLGMNLDWYQERTSERENHTVGGFATALCYDGTLPGYLPYGVEVDWVKGSGVMHVDMNVFCPYGWDLMWLLVLPAVNYLKDIVRGWRSGEQEMVMEGEEEEEEGGGDMGGLSALLGGMQGPEAQAMLQQLMAQGLLRPA